MYVLLCVIVLLCVLFVCECVTALLFVCECVLYCCLCVNVYCTAVCV
jgi:hypothetical protein